MSKLQRRARCPALRQAERPPLPTTRRCTASEKATSLRLYTVPRSCYSGRLMTLDDILLEAEEKMMKTEEVVQHEFAGVRTGKASPGLVENIMVEVYEIGRAH